MPVNYQTPPAEQLYPVAGVEIGTAPAGIRAQDRRDLTLFFLHDGCQVAGVFTNNEFCAAPVSICREHLYSGEEIRALLINTGVANSGMGEEGIQAARQSCTGLANLLAIKANSVLPFSTGVIMEPLPVERLLAGLPQAIGSLRNDGLAWHQAAEAIMTTDTLPKAASRRIEIDGVNITITGIAKGSGMIYPNMATMLAFIATDVGVATPLLKQLVADTAGASFNSISVDGDTSTNDSFILLASGRSELHFDDANNPGWQTFKKELCSVALELAQAIVRDGEGASKFISIHVEGGRNYDECRKIADAIAHSPLVKTAFFAGDPNLGRILAAIGNAWVDGLDAHRLRIWLVTDGTKVLIAESGQRSASYREEDGQGIMSGNEFGVCVDLGCGTEAATVYTCDLSYDYIKINADYRS